MIVNISENKRARKLLNFFALFYFPTFSLNVSEFLACVYFGKILRFLYTSDTFTAKNYGVFKKSRNLLLGIRIRRFISKVKIKITLD